ncbi:MAG: hypothetical protein IPG54_02220 [Sphingomonadales bacterium]|nr:hypothetical protein [Sphingomonadales bacterium]
MTRIASHAISGLALMASAHVSAQETGTLITRKAAQIDTLSEAGARQAMEQFGECIVSREKGRTAKLIDPRVATTKHDKLLDATVHSADQCLSDGTLRTSTLMMRGAIFQALYRRDYAAADAPIAFPAELKSGYRALYPAELSDEARMYLSLNHFGECVSRADGPAVRQLVLSRAGSASESEAITVLMPRFSACIVKDNTIRFSRSNLKGALSEGLYRLSRAAAPQQGSAN